MMSLFLWIIFVAIIGFFWGWRDVPVIENYQQGNYPPEKINVAKSNNSEWHVIGGLMMCIIFIGFGFLLAIIAGWKSVEFIFIAIPVCIDLHDSTINKMRGLSINDTGTGEGWWDDDGFFVWLKTKKINRQQFCGSWLIIGIIIYFVF